MELNFFHKTILVFAFLILGIGIFNSVSQNFMSPYNEISSITQKYDIIAFESLSEPPVLLSQAWLKNMMVSSLIDATPAQTEEGNQLIVKIDNPSPAQNLYLLTFPVEKSLQNIERDLKTVHTVSFVEPNFDIELQQTSEEESIQEKATKIESDEPEIPTNPQLLKASNIEIDEIPEEEPSAPDAFKVAIIDSGVDKSHPSLADTKVYTKTYLSDLTDKVGHGTHLAGLISQRAPEAELYSYKFTDGKTGKLSGVLKAINQAKKDKVNLVNLSLGLPTKSESLQESIDLLRQNDIIVVAAAGNQNTDSEFYPAAFNGVISVGGLTKDGTKLPNSNFGDWIDYSILGQDIYSLAPEGKFKYLTGTSQSAAIISGLIAQYFIQTESTDNPDFASFLSQNQLQSEDDFTTLLGIRVQE